MVMVRVRVRDRVRVRVRDIVRFRILAMADRNQVGNGKMGSRS